MNVANSNDVDNSRESRRQKYWRNLPSETKAYQIEKVKRRRSENIRTESKENKLRRRASDNARQIKRRKSESSLQSQERKEKDRIRQKIRWDSLSRERKSEISNVNSLRQKQKRANMRPLSIIQTANEVYNTQENLVHIDDSGNVRDVLSEVTNLERFKSSVFSSKESRERNDFQNTQDDLTHLNELGEVPDALTEETIQKYSQSSASIITESRLNEVNAFNGKAIITKDFNLACQYYRLTSDKKKTQFGCSGDIRINDIETPCLITGNIERVHAVHLVRHATFAFKNASFMNLGFNPFPVRYLVVDFDDITIDSSNLDL